MGGRRSFQAPRLVGGRRSFQPGLVGPVSARNSPGGRTLYRPVDPDEYSSCPNASIVMAATKYSVMRRFDRFYYFECQLQWLYDNQLDDVIPALLATCRSFGVSSCNEPSCIRNLEMLDEFVPQSEYFLCLRAWVMQVVACHKSQGPLLKPFPRVQTRVDRWQSDPEPLTEVLSLLSWFAGYFGPYEAISPPVPLRLVAQRDTKSIEEYGKETMRGEIDKAIKRAQAYKVCLRRAWVVVSILPGRELNLPALIPDLGSAVVDQYLNHGPKHVHCTRDLCKPAEIDATHLPQLHVCKDRYNCKLTEKGMFPTRKLVDAIKRKQLTAWSLDGLSVFGGDALNRDFSNDKEPFIAISHVWADGTGAGDPEVMQGHVNSCLFEMFCDIARKLHCLGVWWDAVCIPDGEFKKASLKLMQKNYSAAKYTVVHDLYLRHMRWIDAESACLALVLSSWFTRAWTALELSGSDDIYVIFKSDNRPGYVLKNLDRDILLPGRVGGSACQLVTRSIIQTLRKETKAFRSFGGEISYMKLPVNDILIALSGRSLSKRNDRPIIACLHAEVELPAIESKKTNTNETDPPPDPNLCRRVLQGRGIKAENLFHMAEAAKGFGWQPMSLFDLPVSTRDDSGGLRVSPRGDVVGSWAFICDNSPNPDLQAFRNVRFYWPEPKDSQASKDKKASEAQMRKRNIKAITDATRSTMHHVILVDTNERYPTRGILVKVRRWSTGTMRPSNVQDIFGARGFKNLFKEQVSFPCEFVGVVHFSSSELPITTAVTFVLFGTDDENLAMDLSPGMSAWYFINSNVKGLVSKPIFAQRQNNVGRWSNEVPEENRDVSDFLCIPRMRQEWFTTSSVIPDLALPGYDQVQLSNPYALFIPEVYTN